MKRGGMAGVSFLGRVSSPVGRTWRVRVMGPGWRRREGMGVGMVGQAMLSSLKA